MDDGPRTGIREGDHNLFISIRVRIHLVKCKQDRGFSVVSRDRYQRVWYDGDREAAGGVRARPEQIYQIAAL